MSNKIHSVLVRLFFGLLFVTATTSVYYFWPTKSVYPSPILSIQPTQQIVETTNISASNTPPSNELISNNETTTRPEYTEQKFNIAIVAGDRSYPLSVPSSTTVYQAMQMMQIDSRQPFKFSAKQYSGIGYFVEEINGIQNDPSANIYWIMYINGQSAQVGVSAYILQPNDIVTWKFEKSKF